MLAHASGVRPESKPSDWHLAVCVRDQVAALAVMNATEIIEVRRRRVRDRPAGESPDQFLARGVIELAADYAVRRIIVEPNAGVMAIPAALPLDVERLSLVEAKQRLLPSGKRTNEVLFNHLVTKHPKLTRLVTVFPATGRIAMTERRRTVCLLAVAIGLAVRDGRNGQQAGEQHVLTTNH